MNFCNNKNRQVDPRWSAPRPRLSAKDVPRQNGARGGPEWPWAEEEAKWLDQSVLPLGAELEAIVRLS